MDFFKKRFVQIIAWVLWVVSTVVLVLGGITAEGMSSALVAVIGGISAISAVVTLIASFIKKKE